MNQTPSPPEEQNLTADTLTLTLDLKELGKAEVSIETNLSENLEKLPAIAHEVAKLLLIRLSQAVEEGQETVHETFHAAPAQGENK